MPKITDFTLVSNDLHNFLDFQADFHPILETSAGGDEPGKYDTLKP